MSPHTQESILDAAMAVLQADGAVSLDAVARTAGLSKPGVMYHFPTKQALMLALVDHAADGWVTAMSDLLSCPVAEATPRERLGAYLEVSLSGQPDRASLAMLGDPRLRTRLLDRWTERFAPWVEVPEHLAAEERARLAAVRLLADGAWFADATEMFVLPPAEREAVRRLARQLLEA